MALEQYLNYYWNEYKSRKYFSVYSYVSVRVKIASPIEMMAFLDDPSVRECINLHMSEKCYGKYEDLLQDGIRGYIADHIQNRIYEEMNNHD